MAGKAYTMKEMRAIVDYLNERKAYGELKGRKMWMEYANSDKTTRTWQSLKETFLKRILPDIHNPYYKLTMDQVRSFKQGVDVAEKEKDNRLEIRNTAEDVQAGIQTNLSTKDNEVPTTSHENDIQKTVNNNDLPTTSIDDELEKATGEDINAATIPCRSSTETVVLEYENAEEIQRALESPQQNKESKSLKDKLTFEYTAPLTPLVRDVLDDFATESESSDKEPVLNIDEEAITDNTVSKPVIGISENIKEANVPSENDIINHEADSTIEINGSENIVNAEMNVVKETSVVNDIIQQDTTVKSDKPHKKQNSQTKEDEHISKEDTNTNKLSERGRQDNDATNAETSSKDTTEFVTAESSVKALDKTDAAKQKDCNSTIANTENSTQNTCNTSDTLLPNNQEAYDDSKKDMHNANNDKTGKTVEVSKIDSTRSEKRSASKDSRESKKQKLSDKPPNEIKRVETSIPVIEIDDIPSDKETVSVIPISEVLPHTPVIEINTDSSNTINTEKFDALKNTTSANVTKLDIGKEKDNTNTVENKEKQKASVEDKNPCLMSVSLFDEQFNNTKYSDSDSGDVVITTPEQKQKTNILTNNNKEIDDKPQEKVNKNKKTELEKNKSQKPAIKHKEKRATEKQIIVSDLEDSDTDNLDSTGDCEGQLQGGVIHTNYANTSANLRRETTLANVFGFAHGGASTSRKRKLSHRRRSHRQHHRRRRSKSIDFNSSEWTSESDSESYVSPPRGRRNRNKKKYLKPKSSRILREPGEGTLYVLIGKQIYPLVKDGKHVKKYLTYGADSGSDEEESYWRQKYIEERHRVEEIRELFKESLERKPAQANAPTSPSSRRSSVSRSVRQPFENRNSVERASDAEKIIEPKDEKMVLKIAAKNGLEYCLEGGWNQISNAMPVVVKMLQSETPASYSKATPTINDPVNNATNVTCMEVSSGISTPAPMNEDSEMARVKEKVNKIEAEIFNEIEAREKEDEAKNNVAEGTNITKRKAVRRRIDSSSSSAVTIPKNPAKRTRTSKSNSTDSKQETKPAKGKRVSKTKLNQPDQDASNKNETEIPKEVEQKGKEVEQNDETKTPMEVEQKGTATINKTETKAVEKPANVKEKKEQRTSLRLLKKRESSVANSVSEDNVVVGTRTASKQLRTPEKNDTASEIKLRSAKSTSKVKAASLGIDEDQVRFMFPPTEASKTNIKSKEKKNKR